MESDDRNWPLRVANSFPEISTDKRRDVAGPSVQSPFLEVEKIVAAYGTAQVVHGVSFAVNPGERLCLLGPSGCGKTTTLQVIAGFVRALSGEVRIGGAAVTRLAPEKRNLGMVFQNYALFPHLTVYDNVAFGLKMRRIGHDEIQRRVRQALELVRLAPHSAKLPTMLSGGEQQRVAVARAVVIQPRLLLLDEPFSNLDARLRQELRAELLGVLQQLQVSTVFVTHDQEEAMYLADRIAVLNHGNVEQIGTAEELYRTPASLFVARFVGESNTLPGVVTEVSANGTAVIEVAGLGRVVGRAGHGLTAGTRACSIIRPDAVRLVESSGQGAAVNANRFVMGTESAVYLGHRIEYQLGRGGHHLTGWQPPSVTAPAVGSDVMAEWSHDDSLIFCGDDQ